MKPKYVLIGSLLLAASYGAYMLFNQVKLLKQTCVKMVNHRLTGLFSNMAQLSITLRVVNKSDIDLLATNENFDIYINNVFVANMKQSRQTMLARNSATDIVLNASFDPKNLVQQGIAALAQNFNAVTISIKGKLNVKTSLISVNNLKVDTTMTLAQILSPSNQTSNC